jgi:hypothetical protein
MLEVGSWKNEDGSFNYLGSFSAFRSRFFARRSSLQKELHSSRAARDSTQKKKEIKLKKICANLCNL